MAVYLLIICVTVNEVYVILKFTCCHYVIKATVFLMERKGLVGMFIDSWPNGGAEVICNNNNN